jgi:hypothetical protein
LLLPIVGCGGRSGTGVEPSSGTQDPDAGLLINQSSNPLACGQSGTDCRGGGCNDGECSPQPTVLATYDGNSPPLADCASLAVDQTTLYVAEGKSGRIWSMPKGGSQQSDLATGLSRPCELVGDENFLYLITCGDQRVLALPKGGGSLITLATDQYDVKRLAVSNGVVFWLAGTNLYSARPGDPEPTPGLAGIPPESPMTFDDSVMYMGFHDRGFPETDGLYSVAPDFRFVAPISDLSDLVTAGSYVFAATLNTATWEGSVLRISPESGEVDILAEHQKHLDRLVVDSTSVYFNVSDYAGTIRKVPQAGGREPFVLASGHAPGERPYSAACDLAVDDSSVFYTTSSQVLRVAK